MKKVVLKTAAIIIALFACVTLFMSTSVIFDLFGIRAKEGNYVLFVVVSNFIAGFLYLFAAYGLFKQKSWAAKLLLTTTLILILSFIGLLMHVNNGGIYEEKTIKAMVFRVSFTAVFTLVAWLNISKSITSEKTNVV